MPDIPDRLTAALSDRYRIERELGAGGMATVYLAQDLKHDRPVALKVLRPELISAQASQRFLQEIRLTARLDHPHILTLIDSGEADGMLYYVLPFVRGESLREKLTREGPLPIHEAVSLAVQIASALEHAHRQGVIHRDIKPENILLRDGEAVVADFGIGLAVHEAAGDRLTRTGVSLGTPQYMSPEQAGGERQVDASSDVYSLGAVLYEMLTGETPHHGSTAQAIVTRVLTERPTPARALRNSIPEALDAAISRALERTPADRFVSAGVFAGALASGADFRPAHPRRRRLLLRAAGAVGLLAALAAAALWVSPRISARPSAEPTRTQVTFSGRASKSSISPDGRMIAYVERACRTDGSACRDTLKVQELPGGAPLALASVFQLRGPPEWSPDGRSLLFATAFDTMQSGNYLVPRLGGPLRRLSDESFMAFAPDGNTLAQAPAGINSFTVRFMRVSDGAPLDSFAIRLPGIAVLVGIAWSPNGKWLALLGNYGAYAKIVSVATRDGVVVDTFSVPARPVVRWSPKSDALLFLLRGNGSEDRLVRYGLNPRLGRFTGDTATLASLPTVQLGYFNLTADGRTLNFDGVVVTANLVAIELDGERVTSRDLTSSTGWQSWPSISPDGRQVAFAQSDGMGDNLYVVPFEGGTPTLVTSGAGQFEGPRWLRDGRLVFIRMRPVRELLVSDQRGGSPRAFGPPGFTNAVPDYLQWLPDSGYLLQEWDRVIRVDENGAPQDTLTVGQMVTVTPDGRQIWFVGGTPFALRAMDRATRSVTEVAAYSGGTQALGWSQGAFYFASWPGRDLAAGRPTIWRVNPGRQSTRVRELPVRCVGLSMSRDGRGFVCKTSDRPRTDVWVLQGFNPDR